MRKFTLFIIFFCLAFVLCRASFAGGINPYATATEDTSCPAYGAYDFAYDGDYPGDTDKACTGSGAGTLDGTNEGSGGFGSYGESGNGWRYTTDDDNAYYTFTAGTAIDYDAGTVWTKFKCASIPSAQATHIFESYAIATYADDNMQLRIETSGYLTFRYEGNTTTDTVTNSTAVTCDGSTWNTVGFSWQQGVAGDDMSVTTGSTWEAGTVTEDDDLIAWGGSPDKLLIGNKVQLGETITIDFDQIVIKPSWQAECPW